MADTKLTVCLSFDYDAMSARIVRANNPGTISRGEFGAFAIPRILEMLERQNAKATFFVPGHTALAYPGTVREIAAAGHEIGHHGWVHEDPADFDRAGEERNFHRGLDALMEVVPGSKIVGYRSPAASFSSNTIDILLDNGILYDSSLCGTDFWPYYVRQGDRGSHTERFHFGQPSELVEVPLSWALNDSPLFEYYPGRTYSQHTPSQVHEIWRTEFDYAVTHARGGVLTLLMHPQVIGRGSRLAMAEKLVAHMAAQPCVTFETLGACARSWRQVNPLEAYRTRASVVCPTDETGLTAG